MLRQILSAVVSALKSIGRFAGRLALAPLRMLGGLVGGVGGNSGPLAVPPPIEDYAEGDVASVPPGPAPQAVSEQMASIVMEWAAHSIVHESPVPLPPKLPRAVVAWLQGLTREECFAIIDAERSAVSMHLGALSLLPGVRSVRPLAPVSWKREPMPPFDMGSLSFVTMADEHEPASRPATP
jgi:hypothetical protein